MNTRTQSKTMAPPRLDGARFSAPLYAAEGEDAAVMDANAAMAMLYRGANLSVGLSLFAVAGTRAGSREAARSARYGVKLMIGPAHHEPAEAAESRFVSVSLVDLLPRNDDCHEAVDIRLRYSQLGGTQSAAAELSSRPHPAADSGNPFHLAADLPIEPGSYHFQVLVDGTDKADFVVEV